MADITGLMEAVLFGFSMQGAVDLWRPLIIFVIGVAIYSIFIFKFYRFLARRSIFKLKISEYDMHPGLKKFLHGIEVIFLYPIVIFFWFLVMSMMLTVVSVEQTIESILFISVAYVSAVRVSAYYSEDLSKDMAKLIPFALLALFLIDASTMSMIDPLSLLNQMFSMWRMLAYYLVFVILLELVLRLITLGRHRKKKADAAKETEKPGTVS